METEKDFSRYAFLPMENKYLLSFYQRQRDSFWVPNEISFKNEREQWDALKEDERKFLKFILAFFAQVDGIIIENLFENFQQETSFIKEARVFYAAQNFIEVIHNEMYSLLIDTFIRDPEEKKITLNAINHFPSIRKISEWVFSWMDSTRPLMQRVIAMSCVEGIFFTSAFCAIYWIKRQNKLAGLCKANELIARDEALHTEWAPALYKHCISKENFDPVEIKTAHSIFESAVKVSEEFIRDALQVNLIGMNADDMVTYMKCTADYVMDMFDFPKLYNLKNPFEWMVMIALENKSNFFETTVTEYSKPQSRTDVFSTSTYF